MSTVAESAQLLRSWVGGTFRAGDATKIKPDLNPSDREDVVGLVPVGAPDDAAAAVEAAQAALPAWRALPGPARAEHLYRWAEAIAARRDELARAVAREVGKPIGEATGEVLRCVAILRYYAGEAVRAVGEVVPAQAAGQLQFTLRQPLGVVALVTPWNFPVAIPLWKGAPALAFGNTVVLKPAEQASLSSLLLAEAAHAAGLPPGVFNVLVGSGSVVGSALLEQEAVRAVSFTGSGQVGAQVAAVGAKRNIRYQTEMGGKNVVIVARDADLDHAARLTAAGAMRYAGQKCTATSRAIVVKDVEEAFHRKLLEQVQALSLGPVEEATSAVGPLISESTRAYVHQAVQRAGGERLCGGSVPEDPRFQRGFFYLPTVIRGVDPDSELAQDELFAPVLATFVVDDIDHAITVANRTRYGLSASLFTRDIGTALTYIHRIEAGMVRVNGDTTGVDPHAPFGGVKGSSSGTREQGSAAREFYTEIHTVQIQS